MAPARARSTERQQPQAAPTAEATAASGAESAGESRVGHAGNKASATERQRGGHRTATLNLPFVTAEFRRPDLHLPGRRDVGAAADAVAARARSLSPAELAYYAGLGVLAAVELIEWPVAVAVGAGTALARRSGGGGGGGEGAADTASGESGSPGEGGSPGGRVEGRDQK
jgi:hypothetical protein